RWRGAMAASLARPPAAPAVVGRQAAALVVPVLPEVLAAAVGGEAEQETADKRDLVGVRAHPRPPLDGGVVAVDERRAHLHWRVRLGARRSGPVRDHSLLPEVRL